MKSLNALRFARFWAVCAGGHLLGMLAFEYVTDRVGARLKVAPSEAGYAAFRSLDGVADVMSWPLNVLVGATTPALVVLGAILLHSLCWGAVWLALFELFRGLRARRIHAR